MDNNFITNNPLTPYLQASQQEKGLIFYVADFEEFRKSPHSNGNDYIGVTRDLKYVFIKRVDKDGNVALATFDPNQIPNPVPVTDVELSVKIAEIQNGFNNRLASIENRIDKLINFVTSERGNGNNGSNGIFQSNITTSESVRTAPAAQEIYQQSEYK